MKSHNQLMDEAYPQKTYKELKGCLRGFIIIFLGLLAIISVMIIIHVIKIFIAS